MITGVHNGVIVTTALRNAVVGRDWSARTTRSPHWAASRQLGPNDPDLREILQLKLTRTLENFAEHPISCNFAKYDLTEF